MRFARAFPEPSGEVDIAIDAMFVLWLLAATNFLYTFASPWQDLALAPLGLLRVYFYGGIGLAALVVGLCLMGGAPRYRANWQAPAATLAVYAVVSLGSVDPATTVNQLARALVFGATVSVYVQVRGGARALRAMVWLLLAANVLSLAAVAAAPAQAIHTMANSNDPLLAGSWRGVMPHKNLLGQVSAYALIVLAFFPEASGVGLPARVPLLAVCALNLAMSRSATNIVTVLACGLCAVVLLRRRVTPVRFAVSAVVLGGAIVVAVRSVEAILTALGKNPTLTGRTQIWGICWEQVLKRPLTGYGFGASVGFFQTRLQSQVGRAAVDAHNGYLQTLLDVGAIGLAALLLAIGVSVVRALFATAGGNPRVTAANRALAAWLIAGCIIAMGERSPFSLTSYTGSITFLALVGISVRRGPLALPSPLPLPVPGSEQRRVERRHRLAIARAPEIAPHPLQPGGAERGPRRG